MALPISVFAGWLLLTVGALPALAQHGSINSPLDGARHNDRLEATVSLGSSQSRATTTRQRVTQLSKQDVPSSELPVHQNPPIPKAGDIPADVKNVIEFFRTGFSILLALALSEAFKQFVAESDKPMQWGRLPTLVTFLVTIVPFFHGMHRYFYYTYLDPEKVATFYPTSLVTDGVAFMAEAALFFVLSRALSPSQVARVVLTLALLFFVDLLRDAANYVRGVPTSPWLVQNFASCIILLVVAICLRFASALQSWRWPVMPIAVATLAMIGTVVDYRYHWAFYFPPLHQ